MKELWCWRCKMVVPMLDEDEYAIASKLYSQKVEMTSGPREDRYRPLLDYYFQVTGFKETEPNAIMHHRVSLYGLPCEKCGKPYRTPKATFCTACGNKRMKKKLFLDDLRTMDMVYDKSMEPEFDIVRTYADFVEYIQVNGLPELISFDNDLGLDESGNVAPDGYAAAKWLVYESGLDLRNLEFKVHSANPVASEQIRGLLNNYIDHLKKG